jgi:hypothetical protein
MHEINSYILWYSRNGVNILLDSKSPIGYRLRLEYTA